jgi:hypothetical protein
LSILLLLDPDLCGSGSETLANFFLLQFLNTVSTRVGAPNVFFCCTGKIYVENERARLTHRLAKMKEEEGDLQEAARILQELQVETYGSMERKEKVIHQSTSISFFSSGNTGNTSVVDPHRFQCGSGSSFLSPCGSGSREPNNADPDPDPGQILKSHISSVSTAEVYKEMSSN